VSLNIKRNNIRNDGFYYRFNSRTQRITLLTPVVQTPFLNIMKNESKVDSTVVCVSEHGESGLK
jgi:hypothetical protein